MPIQVVCIEILLLICLLIAIAHEIKDLWFTNTSGEIEYFEPLVCLEKSTKSSHDKTQLLESTRQTQHSEQDEEVEDDEEEKCPYGLCDGSGEYDEGEFDDIRTVKCLCKIDQEDDFTGATEGDR